MTDSKFKIAAACDSIKDLLLAKNAKYGDSALSPVRVFSKSSTVEQILVRIDDKISRIQRAEGLVEKDEDVVQDLIGYLILLQIAIADSGAWKGENGYDRVDPWKELDNDYSHRCPD